VRSPPGTCGRTLRSSQDARAPGRLDPPRGTCARVELCALARMEVHTRRTFMDNTDYRVDRWTLDACHLDRPWASADRRTSCPRKAGRSSPRSAAATVRHPVSHSGSMGGTAHSGPWNDWICILDRKTGLGPGERGSVCAPTLVSCSGSSSVCPAGSTRSDS